MNEHKKCFLCRLISIVSFVFIWYYAASLSLLSVAIWFNINNSTVGILLIVLLSIGFIVGGFFVGRYWQNPKKLLYLPVFSLIIGILLLILSLLPVFMNYSINDIDDSDKHLIDNYYKYKTDFNNIVNMFTDDKGLGRVGDGFTRPSDIKTIDLTQKRIDQYHQIFDRLNIPDGIEGYDEKDIIWLHVSSYGLSISGWSKGYVYSNDPSKYGKIVNSLEGYTPPGPHSYTIFQHIEGKWYLYYDYED